MKAWSKVNEIVSGYLKKRIVCSSSAGQNQCTQDECIYEWNSNIAFQNDTKKQQASRTLWEMLLEITVIKKR